MEIDGVNDVQILDPELLQLPGLSPVSLKANPHIAEELFSQWLSLPETGRLVILFPSLYVVLVDCLKLWLLGISSMYMLVIVSLFSFLFI